MNHFFLLATVAYENEVKQIRIIEENLSQSCILCQLLRTKTLASGQIASKILFCFYHYLPCISWVDKGMRFI